MGMIQIRNVPEPLHRALKARAAAAGTSLSEYLLRLAERDIGRPTIEEVSERIRRRGRVELSESPAEIVRRMRDAAG